MIRLTFRITFYFTCREQKRERGFAFVRGFVKSLFVCLFVVFKLSVPSCIISLTFPRIAFQSQAGENFMVRHRPPSFPMTECRK